MHYKRWLNHGTTDLVVHVRGKCVVDDCGKPTVGRGFCRRHYQAWRKYGDPLHRVRSAANHGHVFVGDKGYLYVAVGTFRAPLHRMIAEAFAHRPLQRGEVVHHRDGNILNNDPANLEILSNGAHTALHRPWGSPNHFRTHCRYGHPLSGDNLLPDVLRRTGKRACKACKYAANRRYAQKRTMH